ncbi:hypothetical protein N5V81_13560 [Escherichia coli]|nr:hypothetical protein [Escherichia coli]
MQINRTVSKSKEVVYNVEDGDVMQFRAVIDEQHVLQVVYPKEEMTRAHSRVLRKSSSRKPKQRDGIKSAKRYVRLSVT